MIGANGITDFREGLCYIRCMNPIALFGMIVRVIRGVSYEMNHTIPEPEPESSSWAGTIFVLLLFFGSFGTLVYLALFR